MKNIEKMNEAQLRKYILDLKKMMLSIQRSNMECEKDRRRMDWLADPENKIGNVQLPTEIVKSNPHSLRDAIDAAMKQSFDG